MIDSDIILPNGTFFAEEHRVFQREVISAKYILCLFLTLCLVEVDLAFAQARFQVSVSRESRNFYKVDRQNFWIKTKYCYQYNRREDALLNNEELVFLDAGEKCDVDKIYGRINPVLGNYRVSVTVEDNAYSTLNGILFITPYCFEYVYYEEAIFRSNGYGGSGSLIFLKSGETCEVQEVLSETSL